MSKLSITFPELIDRLQSEQTKKRDFIVPGSILSMRNGQLIMSEPETESTLFGFTDMLSSLNIATSGHNEKICYQPLDILHEQLGEKLDIPRRYYKKMQENDGPLLDFNVNSWFQHAQYAQTNYLLRTYEFEHGRVARALLSDQYSAIDNLDILMSTLKAVKDSGTNIQIQECDISDKKMYVRFCCPDIEHQAPELLKNYRVPGGSPDDGNPGIISGFVISNSETGHGGFSISPRAVILACQNGLIKKEDAFRKIHLGAKLEAYSSINWSKDTKRKNLELIQSQIVDCVKRFTSKDYLGNWVSQLVRDGQKPLHYPMDAVKNVCHSLAMSEEEMNDILGYFIQGGISNAFGVSQCLTHYAHETKDADLQYELETVGVDVIHKIDTYDRKAA